MSSFSLLTNGFLFRESHFSTLHNILLLFDIHFYKFITSCWLLCTRYIMYQISKESTLYFFIKCSMFTWLDTQLGNVITELSSTVSSFLPLLVQVGIGIITATIAFVAVRWLMNWTQAKVRGTFSSWRRRR